MFMTIIDNGFEVDQKVSMSQYLLVGYMRPDVSLVEDTEYVTIRCLRC